MCWRQLKSPLKSPFQVTRMLLKETTEVDFLVAEVLFRVCIFDVTYSIPSFVPRSYLLSSRKDVIFVKVNWAISHHHTKIIVRWREGCYMDYVRFIIFQFLTVVMFVIVSCMYLISDFIKSHHIPITFVARKCNHCRRPFTSKQLLCTCRGMTKLPPLRTLTPVNSCKPPSVGSRVVQP